MMVYLAMALLIVLPTGLLLWCAGRPTISWSLKVGGAVAAVVALTALLGNIVWSIHSSYISAAPLDQLIYSYCSQPDVLVYVSVEMAILALVSFGLGWIAARIIEAWSRRIISSGPFWVGTFAAALVCMIFELVSYYSLSGAPIFPIEIVLPLIALPAFFLGWIPAAMLSTITARSNSKFLRVTVLAIPVICLLIACAFLWRNLWLNPGSLWEGVRRAPLSAIALNPSAPSQLLSKLVHDPDPLTRLYVAYHRNTSAQALTELARDPDARVRQQVAMHPRAPKSSLELLRHDRDETVREQAGIAWEQRGFNHKQ